MLATLPESRRAARPLPRAGTAASVAAHTALFALAVAATGRAAPRPDRAASRDRAPRYHYLPRGRGAAL